MAYNCVAGFKSRGNSEEYIASGITLFQAPSLPPRKSCTQTDSPMLLLAQLTGAYMLHFLKSLYHISGHRCDRPFPALSLDQCHKTYQQYQGNHSLLIKILDSLAPSRRNTIHLIADRELCSTFCRRLN